MGATAGSACSGRTSRVPRDCGGSQLSDSPSVGILQPPPPRPHPTQRSTGRYLELIEAEGEVEDLGKLLGQGLLPLKVLGRSVWGAGEGLQQAPQGVLWGRSTAGPPPAPVHLPSPSWGN